MAVTFAYSAATKVAGRAAYADFRGWLTSAAAVPRRHAGAVAAVMVAAEAAVALAMLVPPLPPAGYVTAILLLAVFTAGVRSMMRRRVGIPCKCFGTGRRPPGRAHLARNAILAAVAAAGLLMSAAGAAAPPIRPETALTAIAGITAALLLINLDELVALYRPRAPRP